MSLNARSHLNRFAAACIAALAPYAALAASGEFTFVVGDVTLNKPGSAPTKPVRGTTVDPGDRIVTGANGMAQLTMVDQARLSLRPSTQFVIEAYPDRRDSDQGGVLNLIKGTLRTFTGLIASSNRERFVMKTRVATVGIRGSGNILYACEDKECDESVSGVARVEGALTVNHTIDGSHAISGTGTAGQGTLVTGPGQTVLVAANQAPRYIPTPRFIADLATNMTGAKDTAPPPAGGSSAETRNFSPSDTPVLPSSQQNVATNVGNSVLTFPTIDATGNLGSDPLGLRDVVISSGSPLFGQSLPGDVVLEGNSVRAYAGYPGSLVRPTVVGGAAQDFGSANAEGGVVTWGRWANASLSFFGGGGAVAVPGSIHWINAPSGYPAYLAEVLTGTVAYTLVGGTQPTNQNNVVGALGTATLNVNFTNRSLGFNA